MSEPQPNTSKSAGSMMSVPHNVFTRQEIPQQPEGDNSSISTVEMRSALCRILGSPEFQSVPQLRVFLSFVVERVIEGRSDEIKGYTIAVEGLGRPDSFNPVSDPIVRVEASRLRQRLAKYYEGSGEGDSLRVCIPTGSYVPAFSRRPCATSSTEKAIQDDRRTPEETPAQSGEHGASDRTDTPQLPDTEGTKRASPHGDWSAHTIKTFLTGKMPRNPWYLTSHALVAAGGFAVGHVLCHMAIHAF